jgi:hypothetical protein
MDEPEIEELFYIDYIQKLRKTASRNQDTGTTQDITL